MAKLLPDDFRDFLKLCNQKRVKYLLIGGYGMQRVRVSHWLRRRKLAYAK